MQTFLEEMARAPGGAPDLAFFHDNFCFGCNTFNGGFVYQRNTPAARQCLADWDEESSSNNFTKYVKDQVRLRLCVFTISRMMLSRAVIARLVEQLVIRVLGFGFWVSLSP